MYTYIYIYIYTLYVCVCLCVCVMSSVLFTIGITKLERDVYILLLQFQLHSEMVCAFFQVLFGRQVTQELGALR
jgi:hypothetical protein